MIAFEIFLNGRKIALAGTEDLSVLTGVVDAVGKLGRQTSGTKAYRKNYDLRLTVGGLTGRVDGTLDEYQNWITHKKLKVGDRVEIRVRKVALADSPVDSTPTSPEQEERLQYKWAKSQYLKLRKKYEQPKAHKGAKRA